MFGDGPAENAGVGEENGIAGVVKGLEVGQLWVKAEGGADLRGGCVDLEERVIVQGDLAADVFVLLIHVFGGGISGASRVGNHHVEGIAPAVQEDVDDGFVVLLGTGFGAGFVSRQATDLRYVGGVKLRPGVCT